jgi:hypothetical protein
MAETLSAAVDQAVPADLVKFLKAIPDGRYRHGMSHQQWFLLVVAVLGLTFKSRPSDATLPIPVQSGPSTEVQPVASGPDDQSDPRWGRGFEQLVSEGKTLRGSVVEAGDGSHRFVDQVTVHARADGVSLDQTFYDTGESSERAALKELLSTLELKGVLIVQADALLTTRPYFSGAWSRGPTCS